MACATFEEAVARQHEALAAFMHRDTQPYKELLSTRDDITLANPFGGIAHGWDEVPDRVDRAALSYTDGELVSVETIASDHSSDFGYSLEIERLRGRLGNNETVSDLGLRTTCVFRCEDGDWKLVHRHADPAVDLRLPEGFGG